MEYIELGLGIREYSITHAQLTSLELYIQRAKKFHHLWRSSVTLGKIADYRTSSSLDITIHKQAIPCIADMDRLLFSLFNAAIIDYQNDYGLRIGNDEGYEILTYTTGQQYKKHIDQGGQKFGRIVSGLLYVNDDYIGGSLEFTRLNLTIQPKRGTIILFPSNFIYEHIAHPVTQGEKIAIVTFFHPIEETKIHIDPHGAFNL